MTQTPIVSFVLATYNRRAVVANTVERVRACGLARGEFEIIAVDNASTDGTAEALRERGDVQVIGLADNLGSCAKALGVDAARGGLIVFLEDDSYPRPG